MSRTQWGVILAIIFSTVAMLLSIYGVYLAANASVDVDALRVVVTGEEEVEEELSACTLDAMMCPDGSYVGRSGPNCEFEECPETPELSACTRDLYTCPDGTSVGRTGADCEFVCP